jgi:hypothetical protein
MTSGPVTVVKDMAITLSSFFRLLPRALTGSDHVIDGQNIQVGTAECGVMITIEEAEPRRIALVVIERCIVTLTFTGYDDAEREAFLILFDRAYQRGGG